MKSLKNKLLFLFIFFTILSLAQEDSTTKYKSQLYNLKKVNFELTDYVSASNYSRTGDYSNNNSYRSRYVFFYYSKGDAPLIRVDKRGKNLRAELESDTAALREFDKAYKVVLKKKRRANRLEGLSYAVAFLVLVPAALAGTAGLIGVAVACGAVSLSGFVGIYYFHWKTDQFIDEFNETVKNSVKIYNKNLKQKIESGQL